MENVKLTGDCSRKIAISLVARKTVSLEQKPIVHLCRRTEIRHILLAFWMLMSYHLLKVHMA